MNYSLIAKVNYLAMLMNWLTTSKFA